MSLEVVLHSIFSAAFLASVLRISTPIILPALGGLLTDLSGAINIALEGIMLTSAFTGVVVSAYSHSVFLGVLAGVLAGVAISFVLGWFHLYMETNIILAGTAINILATGGTVFLLYVASGMVPNVVIPLIKDIPFLGKVISGQHIFVWLAFILTWLTAIYLYKTPWGAHLRAVGENPAAAASVGINVKRTQMTALLLSGFLASFGGMTMSMAYLPLFQREMTAGRGFIALAAVYLGGRKPWGTLLAAILFGFADALSNQFGSMNIPSQLVQTLPYIVTIAALVIYALRDQAIKRERQRKFHQQQEAAIKAASEA
jgi:ABC-type uncharacterized transport system permease subunit